MGRCGLHFYGAVILLLHFNYYVNVVVTAGLINSNLKGISFAVKNNVNRTSIPVNLSTTVNLTSALTKPDNSEEAKTAVAGGQLTSETNQKITRQINPNDDTISSRSKSTKQSNPSTDEAHIGRRPSSNAQTFDGFPEDFTQGLPPFQFQDENHQRNPITGFTDFPNDERFPSLAGKLGGLKPISSSSRPTSTSSATKVSSTNLPADEVDPQLEGPSRPLKHHGQQFSSTPEDELFDPRFSTRPRPPHSSRRPPFLQDEHIRPPPPDDHNGPPPPDFEGEFQDSKRGSPINGRVRNFEEDFGSGSPLHDDRRFQSPRLASSFHPDQSDSFQTRPIIDESEFQPPAKSSRPIPSRSRPLTDDQTSNAGLQPADDQFESFNEAPARTTSGKVSEKPVSQSHQFDPEFDLPPPRDDPRSVRTRERRPINQQHFENFPDDGQSFRSEKPSSHSQSHPSGSKFRDSDQFDFSQQQQFIPVTQFNENPFSFSDFGGFRPQISNDAERGFRNSPNRQQQRIPQNFQNEFDNQGFSEADPNTFTDPAEDEQKSNFEDFRGQQLNQDEPETNKASEFDEHQQSPQQQSTSNNRNRSPHESDDNINHHSSATNNILGSGNFGVLRGGIFADSDHSNSHSQFQPLGRNSQFHGGSYDDFFDGFRDFQPFGGSLHNALSSQSEKMHKVPSRTSQVHQPHQSSQRDIVSSSIKLDNSRNNSALVQG